VVRELRILVIGLLYRITSSPILNLAEVLVVYYFT